MRGYEKPVFKKAIMPLLINMMLLHKLIGMENSNIFRVTSKYYESLNETQALVLSHTRNYHFKS